MKRELEFEIVDNKILNVLDYDWFIDRIDAVYVRHSETGRKSEYAIFIQQDSEIVELYFRSRDEMIIAREYKKLCASLKEVNPMFDNSVETFVLINYSNLQNVKFDSSWKGDFINLQFKNFPLYINGGKNKFNNILGKQKELNETNKTI